MEFQNLMHEMVNELDLIRDVLAYIHLVAPFITLVLVIMYSKSCDPNQQIPGLYSVFYWVFCGFQALFGLLNFFWIYLTRFVPLFTKAKEYLGLRLHQKLLKKVLRDQSSPDIEKFKSASNFLPHSSPVFWELLTIPFLKQNFTISLTDQQLQVISSQGRLCFICKDSFDQQEAVCLAPDCRHLFHSTCYFASITNWPYCKVCKSSLTKHARDEILEMKQMTRNVVDQEISILPAIPPSNGNQTKFDRLNRFLRHRAL